MIMCEFCYVSRDLVMEMMRLMLIMIWIVGYRSLGAENGMEMWYIVL